MKAQIWVGVAAVLVLSAAANAAIAWAVPNGAQPNFTFDNGQSTNGKFGNGTSVPTGFVLAPNQFVASANGTNTPVTTADTASVVIHPNSELLSVQVSLLGDRSSLNGGSSIISGQLRLHNLDNNVAVAPLAFTPSNQPTFSGGATLDVDPGTLRPDMRIELFVELRASATSNSVSLIELKDVEIKLNFVPEPTSLALSLAGTLLTRRTRK